MTLYKDTFDIIRTPLGGFLNHSVTPNCKCKTESKFYESYSSVKHRTYLITTRDIKAGE